MLYYYQQKSHRRPAPRVYWQYLNANLGNNLDINKKSGDKLQKSSTAFAIWEHLHKKPQHLPQQGWKPLPQGVWETVGGDSRGTWQVPDRYLFEIDLPWSKGFVHRGFTAVKVGGRSFWEKGFSKSKWCICSEHLTALLPAFHWDINNVSMGHQWCLTETSSSSQWNLIVVSMKSHRCLKEMSVSYQWFLASSLLFTCLRPLDTVTLEEGIDGRLTTTETLVEGHGVLSTATR